MSETKILPFVIEGDDHRSMAEYLYAACHELNRDDAVELLQVHLRDRDRVARALSRQPKS